MTIKQKFELLRDLWVEFPFEKIRIPGKYAQYDFTDAMNWAKQYDDVLHNARYYPDWEGIMIVANVAYKHLSKLEKQ